MKGALVGEPTVFPILSYDDAPAAIDFLIDAFGAERHAVYAADDGTIQHAEIRLGNGIVMLGSSRADSPATRNSIYVIVEDPDAHCERARAAGATIVMELRDTEYSSRDYGAWDPEGNTWYFGTYQPFAAEHTAEAEAKAPA
jgi:uncharacterized glyoxalase superfamily protein PhnB